MTVRRSGNDENLNHPTTDQIAFSSGGIPAADFGALRQNSDDRLSMFWRVFGGTILSIVALVGVTLYNNLNSTILDLRAEVSRTNEARGEMVKKEEFNSRTSQMWDRVSGLQDKAVDAKAFNEKLGLMEQRLRSTDDDHKALAKAELTIAALEQKAAVRDTQMKALEDDRKDLAKQIQELRERLAKVEGVTETKPMPKTTAHKE